GGGKRYDRTRACKGKEDDGIDFGLVEGGREFLCHVGYIGAGLLMIVDQRQIGRGAQMANRAAEPKPQGHSESHFVANDAGNTARLLDHFAHLIERFHVEGNEDSVGGAQPHIIPSCNRRLCEPAISKPATFVKPRKVGTYAHDQLPALPPWSQHACRSPMTRSVTRMRWMTVVVLQLSPRCGRTLAARHVARPLRVPWSEGVQQSVRQA